MIRKQHARDRREAEKQKRQQERLQNALGDLTKGVSAGKKADEATVSVRWNHGYASKPGLSANKAPDSSAPGARTADKSLNPARKITRAVSAEDDEAETRAFLEYISRENIRIPKDQPVVRAQKKNISGPVMTVNLEQGMPVVESALRRMEQGLTEARFTGCKAVKLIHGYGSTGRGGSICTGVRSELARMHRTGKIKDYIPGEEFGAFDHRSRRIADLYPGIVRDPDYGKQNHGITIVVL